MSGGRNLSSECSSMEPRKAPRIIGLILLNSFIVCAAQTSDERRVFLKVHSLPEPFANDKLPRVGKQQETNATKEGEERCYNMIGCFEKVPVMSLPQDPQDLKTEFRMHDRSLRESVIAVERVENCLASKPTDCDRFPFDLQQLLEAPFKPERRTVIIIGGYFSKAPSTWEERVKNHWLRLLDVNVIIVSWVGGNRGLYNMAAVNTRPVARQLTVLLYYLAQLNEVAFDASLGHRIYIVGHSLGAHIAGFVGQDFAGQLGRITGLEPAGPQFDGLPNKFRLDRSDAQLVDVMHTNAGSSLFTMQSRYGSALTSGHVDLYANDGFHQPGCSNDLFGCSHKKANHYYESFLKHQLAIREYLNCDNCYTSGILRAFAGNSFEEFRNGTSITKLCPRLALGDDDSTSIDLDRCSIPIDYVSPFDFVRSEFHTKNGIDFDSGQGNKYYFHTSAETDDQTDHYLFRLKMLKAGVRESELGGAAGKGCDFRLKIAMANGMSNKLSMSKYVPIDRGDHYEIVVPFLSPNFVSKFELAKLDNEDFFLAEQQRDFEKTRASLAKVLPASIKMDKLSYRSARKESTTSSMIEFFKRLFGSNKETESQQQQQQENPTSEQSTAPLDPRCSLPVASVMVQPLKKMRRHLAAFYSVNFVPEVQVIVLKGQSGAQPELDLIKAAAPPAPRGKHQDKEQEASSQDESVRFLYMRSAVIGPPEPAGVSRRAEGDSGVP